MPNKTTKQRVFLSMPISDNLAADGMFRPEKRAFYENVINAIKDLQFEVECAALNEDWGRIKLPTVQFTEYDVEAINRSDFLILVTSERLTRDMYLEIGIAIGLNLPVFLFIPASAHLTFMMEGLEEMAKVKVVKYDAESEVPRLIQEIVHYNVESSEHKQP